MNAPNVKHRSQLQRSTMACRTCLFDVLSVQLVLLEVCSHLPFPILLNLANASKSFRSIMYDTPGIFRRLDLSGSPMHMAMNNEFCNGWDVDPLRQPMAHEKRLANCLRRSFVDPCLTSKRILDQAQLLILDDQAVPEDVLKDLLLDPSIPLRILSVIDWTRGAAFCEVFDALSLLCSTVCPEKRTLQGIYAYGATFNVTSGLWSRGSKSVANGVTSSLGATLGCQDLTSTIASGSRAPRSAWYHSSGPLLKSVREGSGQGKSKWSCNRLLGLPFFFDAVKCRSLEHDADETVVASFSLPPCEICKSAPEGLIDPSLAPTHDLPLLTPIPFRPSIKLAQQPSAISLGESSRAFLARCADCVDTDRWCSRCGRFWCEDCYDPVAASQQDGQGVAAGDGPASRQLKVYQGLCGSCLVVEMYRGAGSGGMWG